VTVEGHNQVAADHALAALRPLWRGTGAEVTPSVPIALRAKPYSIRGVVGIAGERWVPVHGLFPLSRAQEVVTAIQAYFAEHAPRLAAHGIDHSYLTASTGAYWLLEPMFYWRDALTPLHARLLGDKFHKFKDIPPNPEARAVVHAMRTEVAALFDGLGAVHAQIGKFYDFAGTVEPATYALLTDIKRLLDPHAVLNPGNFGWR
jgi:D-lactate dehydrogenase (cytochrome)